MMFNDKKDIKTNVLLKDELLTLDSSTNKFFKSNTLKDANTFKLIIFKI